MKLYIDLYDLRVFYETNFVATRKIIAKGRSSKFKKRTRATWETLSPPLFSGGGAVVKFSRSNYLSAFVR